MMHLVPGDPLDVMFREQALTAEDRALLEERLGLNLPLHVQYWNFLSKAARGDLGESLFIRRPVVRIILDELPFTARLAIFGMGLAIILGIILGVAAALTYNSWIDTAVMIFAITGVSIPSFWMSLLLMLLFCVTLGWLPVFGEESVKTLILPTFVIGYRYSAIISRMVRSGLLEVLSRDYIRTARGKGVSERAVIVVHALKNALIPVITFMGLQFGSLLAGTVFVEVPFARRGVGTVVVTAVLQRDFPLAQGTVLFIGAVYIIVNLGTDLLYAVLDPRIRYD
jgi:ABC-type dipeptide/oligopeptide/nickel transport system permease component